MTLEQTQPIGWIIGIIIGVVFYAVVIYFDRRNRMKHQTGSGQEPDNQPEENPFDEDNEQNHFRPKTDNICDHCHWMQFNINDKTIPCKRCRHYSRIL